MQTLRARDLRLLLCGLAFFLSAIPLAANAFDRSVFDRLDTGIYWYRNATAAVKADGSFPTGHFTNGAPVAIYIHGWQNGSTQALRRETFDRPAASAPVDLTAAWKGAGWNLGIFYWNQLADEGEVKDAEAKIWSTAGPRKMRWRKSDGSYVDSGIQQTAAQIFLQNYKDSLRYYTGNEVRLIGHSLGSQMVINGAKLIADAIDRGELPARLLPKRIALLDPAFLQDGRPYLGGRWTGEVARDYVDALKARGVIFEALRTSGATSNGLVGDTNNGLMVKTAFRELKPWYFGMFDFGGKHNAAVWHYFWEFAFAPANIVGESGGAPAASATNDRTRALMNSSRKYPHDQGAWSKSPGDDTYKYTSK